MDLTNRTLGRTITIKDIELRTQKQRKLSVVARHFYAQFSLSNTLRSTADAKEIKSRTSWNEQLFFDLDDRLDIRVDVYQKHLWGSDKRFGSSVITGVLENLKDGVRVLEYPLRKDNSDVPDLSGVTIKFALAAQPRSDVNADELQAEETVALATEGVNASSSSPTSTAIEHFNSAVHIGKKIANKVQTVSLGHPLGDLLDKMARFNEIVAGIAQIHPYASLAWSVISAANQLLINQKNRDDRISRLADIMSGVFVFVRDTKPLEEIKAHIKVVTLLIQQVTECGRFITEYAEQKSFWIRMAKYAIVDIDSAINDYESKFGELKTAFLEGVSVQTEITVVRMMNFVDEIAQSIDLDGMLYADGAKFQPEKGCLLGTREFLLCEICSVLDNDMENTPHVYLLTGAAGSGKSAVAHSIARLYYEQERLGSSYFFDTASLSKRNPQNLFSTIARDISDRDRQYKVALWGTIKDDRALRTSQSLVEQVEKFIIEPGEHLHTGRPLVIVIDALDESGDRAGRRQLLATISEKIANGAFPAHFRFLITTRPEDDILTKLQLSPHIVHKDIGNIPKDVVNGDIEKFISYSLQDYVDIISSESRRLLVQHSQQLFQWAFTACKVIRGENDLGLDPQERLDKLLQAASTGGGDSLDELYRAILTRLFASEDSKERFRTVMAIVFALNEPLSLASLSALLGGNPNVRPIIKPMGSLLDGVLDEDKPIHPLHTSFRDFLLDGTRSAHFQVIIQRQHSVHLGRASLRCMRDLLRSNIGDMDSEDSHIRRTTIPNQPTRIKQAIPPHIAYSCRYWVNHMQLAGSPIDMLNDITQLFQLFSPDDTPSLPQSSCDSDAPSIADVVSNAFSYIVRRGDFQMAVELLEQARGILWNQLACFDTPVTALDSLGKEGHELANRFVQLSADLKEHAGGRGGDAPDSYLLIKEEWQSVVNKIRQIDGFSRFLLPPQFQYLQQAAERGPVIIVNVGKHTCDALMVLSAQPLVHVPLPDCSLVDIFRLSSQLSSVIRDPRVYGQDREPIFKQLLRDLWTTVVEPIVNALQDDIHLPFGSRIWWCPTSKLGTLPLHAAGPYIEGKKNLMDLYISSYAPSLSTLVRARERQKVLDTSRTSTVISFAAVGQSHPYDIQNLPPLPEVEREINKIQTETDMPVNVQFEAVTGDAATVEGAIKAFHDHHWIHLACHGAQDQKNPFDSWFALRDGPLTLMRIIREQYTRSEFAFLSACHTAVGDASAPDEVLHLAAGMQFAGFNGVIGTLWQLDEAIVSEVVTRFYREMFKQPVINFEHAARALDVAVTETREVSLESRFVFVHIGI